MDIEKLGVDVAETVYYLLSLLTMWQRYYSFLYKFIPGTFWNEVCKT